MTDARAHFLVWMQCNHTWCPFPPPFLTIWKKHKYTACINKHTCECKRTPETYKTIPNEDECENKRTLEQQNKPWLPPTWVTRQDLYTPGLACGLWDGGTIGVQQNWTRARKTQQAAEHIFRSCPWEQRKRKRQRVNPFGSGKVYLAWWMTYLSVLLSWPVHEIIVSIFTPWQFVMERNLPQKGCRGYDRYDSICLWIILWDLQMCAVICV